MTTWRDNSALVLDKLEEFKERFDKIEAKIDALVQTHATSQIELAGLRAKVGIFAAIIATICGALPSSVSLLIQLVKHR